jgi:glutaryl-CoA dehydrogenase (non-decarboxylating)
MTILQWGTEEQKKKYLTPLASGEKIGCGAFSEPGAG